ncbi:MAG TPA: STM3941 family protein [Puia sp.]|nr:STM3941 family protein [Puia sp.]
MNSLETIEIPISKHKAGLLFVASLVFVIVGLFFVISPGTFVSVIARTKWAISVPGYLSVVVFGFFGITILRKIFDKRPGLTISKEGITDNSGGVSAGFIPWSDITAIREEAVGNQRFLNVVVKNPQDYIDRQRSWLKRKIVRKNLEIFGMPIGISTNALKIDYEELKQILDDKLFEAKNDRIKDNF